jgi:hypothetical protein
MDSRIRNSRLETTRTALAHYLSSDVPALDLDHSAWNSADPTHITRYWSGEAAAIGRHAEARILWSHEAISIRYICNQVEPLVVSATPQTEKKTIGLWDKDVCEIFIAPDVDTAERYFEFEAAPTGEWLDLAIQTLPETREADWEFRSGMTTAARIEKDSVVIAMRIPWGRWSHEPRKGERWRVNLFRCVGSDPTRGYLAWQPTLTPQPNFHAPQAFGWLRFA